MWLKHSNTCLPASLSPLTSQPPFHAAHPRCHPQASNYTAGDRTISFENPCDYFTLGKAKASTLSLSVLVAIEML